MKFLMDALSIPYVDFEDDLLAYTATGLMYKVVLNSLVPYKWRAFSSSSKLWTLLHGVTLQNFIDRHIID
jgi:hypothetical protein